MNAYLFKTEKSVKIVVISDVKPNYFDMSKKVVFSEMLNQNTITYVDEFLIEYTDGNNKINIEDKVLSILQPDILIKEVKVNPKIVNYNDHACVCIESPEIKDFQDYYTLFLLIDQIKSIKANLDLE